MQYIWSMRCSTCKRKEPHISFSLGKKKCDGCVEAAREWYQKNRQAVRDRSRSRYYENREAALEQMKKNWLKKDPIYRWATRTIYFHKRKGFEVTVTRQHLIDLALGASHCWLCKKRLAQHSPDYKEWLTVDRIDNNRGLVPDNIHIICLQCNSRKRSMSLRRFAQIVNK